MKLSRRQFCFSAAALGASLLAAQGAAAQSLTLRRLYCPVLMYHYVSPIPDDADAIRKDLTVPPELFAAQLQTLRAEGYTSITMMQLWEALLTGKALPEKPIVLTFDDGYADAYQYALPLLLDYQMVGTFFLVVNFMDHPLYLSWAQALEMQQAGMEMGNHSMSHPDLSRRDAAYLKGEIEDAALIIGQRLGLRPQFFCYPAGRYDAQTMKAVQESGHLAAVTTSDGTLQWSSNLYSMNRVRVRNTTDAAGLRWLLNRRV